MIDHLLAIKEAVATASAAERERFLKGYERIVEAGYAQNPVATPTSDPNAGVAASKANATSPPPASTGSTR